MNLIHEAIIFAARKHAGQVRKGTDIPYITHPMEVMQILTAENSCSDNVIIAGILHDTLEDTKTSPSEIYGLFGEDVLKLVIAESEDKSKTWKERKQATIDRLVNATIGVQMVCVADKLANLRSMASDKADIGDKLWERFNAPKDDIEWYYRAVLSKMFNLRHAKMYGEYSELLEQVFNE